MPWVSIIIFILSYYLSKENGASDGEAAAIGAAAGLATYYVADPANPDNLMGFGTDAKAEPGSTDTDLGNAGSTAGKVLTSGISTAGGVLSSWGPTGTMGVIAGTTALQNDTVQKYLPWLLIGGVALFLLK